ncbi:phage major capsid protein, HK97 family [Paracoccus halophilus]|uniref:Phage major capsid protein, HK97 family n=1 Tax=Paracoccus halophilus TaxID=376733 RepID=A0A099F466_9RHOB|nr:phage major capsid protein [Paracoccus halophilus]KGJ04996.1 hypothetical protein IT41_08220 [Paracoccus halophilus]SFA39638.1 phage major capsid protein, HK97 family [Paracoccus halophilus]
MNDHIKTVTALANRVEDGAALAWALRGKALDLTPDRMAELGAPAKAIQIRKTLTSGVVEAAGPGPVKAFAEAAATQSAFFRFITDRSFQLAPMDKPLIHATADGSAALVEDGAPIPAMDVDLDGAKLTLRKAAAIIVATEQAWGDISSEGQAYINALLRKAVGQAVDAQMVAGLGTIPGFTAPKDDIAAIRAGFQSMAELLIREAGQRLRWVLSPRAVAFLAPTPADDRITVNLDGTGQIFGAPVAVSNALPAGDLLLVSASDVAANMTDVRIDTSSEGAVALAGAPLISLFQTHSIASRVIVGFGLEPMRATVAARLTLTE